jgi:predicted RNA-binding protein with PUA domain
MELSLTHLILAILGLLGGGLGTFIVNFYTNKRQKDIELDKQDASQKIAENDQALHVYKDIVETISNSHNMLTDRIIEWSNKCDKNNELVMEAIKSQRQDTEEFKKSFFVMSMKLDDVLTTLKPKP